MNEKLLEYYQNELFNELTVPYNIFKVFLNINNNNFDYIKEEYIKRSERVKSNKSSPYLLDILDEAEGEGCASCFI